MKEERQCGTNKTQHYSSRKEDEFVLLAGKWTELESIVISELSDHTDTYRHSPAFKLEIENDMSREGRMLRIWESEQEDGTWG